MTKKIYHEKHEIFFDPEKRRIKKNEFRPERRNKSVR